MNQKELFDLINKDKQNGFHRSFVSDERLTETIKGDITGVSFLRCIFDKNTIRKATFKDCTFTNCVFMYCTFDDVEFSDCNILGTPLLYCGLQQVLFLACDVKYVDFSVSRLEGDVSFVESYLLNCNFYGVEGEVFFRDSELDHTVISDMDTADDGQTFKNCKFKHCPGFYQIVPEEGSFIGFKKCYNTGSSCIVKLEIPADAKRSSSTGRKCRASKAKVLAIYDAEHKELDINQAHSVFYPDFAYRVGEIVEVDDFDCDRWNECAPGIHFFLTFEEAVNYM